MTARRSLHRHMHADTQVVGNLRCCSWARRMASCCCREVSCRLRWLQKSWCCFCRAAYWDWMLVLTWVTMSALSVIKLAWGSSEPSCYEGNRHPSRYDGSSHPSHYEGISHSSSYDRSSHPSHYEGSSHPSHYEGVAHHVMREAVTHHIIREVVIDHINHLVKHKNQSVCMQSVRSFTD